MLMIFNSPEKLTVGVVTAADGSRALALRYRDHRILRGKPVLDGLPSTYTDDDTVVDKHWLSRLVAVFADADVAAVTGLIHPYELRTPAQLAFEVVGGFGRIQSFEASDIFDIKS